MKSSEPSGCLDDRMSVFDQFAPERVEFRAWRFEFDTKKSEDNPKR